MRSIHVFCVSLGLLAAAPAGAAEPRPAPSATDKAVKAVQKEATVARNYLEEAMINGKVRAVLLKNLQGADGARVKVEVVGNRVTLTGEVQERASMKLADEVARSVEGVKAVKNDITLMPGSAQNDGLEARMKDTLLENELRLKLLKTLGEGALKVELGVADGVVVVRGPVKDTAARDAALATLRGTAGVREVKDLLVVP